MEAELDLDAPAQPNAERCAWRRWSARWSARESRRVRTSWRRERGPRGAPMPPEVLVVEDNADMRRLLVASGRRASYRVRSAPQRPRGRSRRRARAHARSRADRRDDARDVGHRAVRGAEDRSRDARGIPVVLVTSKAEREMKIEGLELGRRRLRDEALPSARAAGARALRWCGCGACRRELAMRNALLESTNARAREHARGAEGGRRAARAGGAARRRGRARGRRRARGEQPASTSRSTR